MSGFPYSVCLSYVSYRFPRSFFVPVRLARLQLSEYQLRNPRIRARADLKHLLMTAAAILFVDHFLDPRASAVAVNQTDYIGAAVCAAQGTVDFDFGLSAVQAVEIQLQYSRSHMTSPAFLDTAHIGGHGTEWGIPVALFLCQIVALTDHAADIRFRHAAVQYDGIPVRLIQVIGRDHRLKCFAPEIAPLGVTFDINPDMAVPLKDPCKDTPARPVADDAPVWIVEGVIFVGVRVSEAVADGFFAGLHGTEILSLFAPGEPCASPRMP